MSEGAGITDERELVQRIYVWARAGAREILHGRSADIEDVVQELCLKLLKKKGQWQHINHSALRNYVRTAARHLALNLIRGEKVRQRYSAATKLEAQSIASAGDANESFSDREKLRQAVSTLCEEERAILVMRLADGLTASEIAQTLGTSEGAIRTRWYRIIRKLRSFLDPQH